MPGGVGLISCPNKQALNDQIPGDIIANPDLVATRYPMLSAAWFWDHNNINNFIDTDDASIYDVTRKVNGGLNGINERIHLFEFYSDILYDV